MIGIPKTIDNDIPYIGQSFGFQTSFTVAARSIQAARVEAQSAVNGVGLVRVMGRHSGFIACYAALANHDADFVLDPGGSVRARRATADCWPTFAARVAEKGSAVVVVAGGSRPGTGHRPPVSDASGNAALADIGSFLKDRDHRRLSGRPESR